MRGGEAERLGERRLRLRDLERLDVREEPESLPEDESESESESEPESESESESEEDEDDDDADRRRCFLVGGSSSSARRFRLVLSFSRSRSRSLSARILLATPDLFLNSSGTSTLGVPAAFSFASAAGLSKSSVREGRETYGRSNLHW